MLAKVCGILAVELQLCFRCGRLEVHAKTSNDPDLFEKLSGVLLFLWKFTKFADSRWCTVGVACRSLAAGLLTGVESLVAHIKANPKSSKYHIGGFDRRGHDAKSFVVMASMVAHPSGSLLSELLEDDRVPLRLEAL